MAELKPFAYRPGSTVLHRIPVGVKLLALLLISLSALFSFFGLLVSIVFINVLALMAGIRPWELLRGSRPILVMILFVLVFRSLDLSRVTALPETYLALFDYPGFLTALHFGLGVLVSFSAGALLFSVTTMMELKDSLDRLETIIVRVLPWRRPSLSLGISLMLGFIPRFFEVWENADLAYRARCGKGGLTKLVVLIPLVTERMIALAADTALFLFYLFYQPSGAAPKGYD
jgi:biotin transport system permease protein